MRRSGICHLSSVIFKAMIRDVDESLPVGKWAYGLMVAFLVCLIAVSWAVAVDWQSRQEIEKITQPTAVGDPITVVFDPKKDRTKEIVRWKGTSYFAVQNGVDSLQEYNTFKLGLDDSGKTWLYEDKNRTNEILVKIGANQFLRLSPK
jgi:hypothetical protein